ncbi:DUF4198 domain-containing protein [Pseudomarimonas arenosa]|uniref:DUF4198 domain-containing protein n=1 Tax=Pseudomarimonas arenosa TaxID=2774145 RepID=A0AAW3ZK74_9GAMM|nr:DUF4198 domain-containing protein [Pseudomarimonas arenosa]MBD8525097.1 DUF4198 domain-containing protein [Pseudomarimonas arenosa]
MLALVIAPWPLSAHEFWLEPDSFRPLPASLVAVRLKVGEPFAGEAVVRRSASIRRFDVHQEDGVVALSGSEGIEPAGWFRYQGPRAAVVAYRGQPWVARLSLPRFQRHLAEDGWAHLIEHDATGSNRGDTVAESVEREAKALLGDLDDPQHQRRIGLNFEIVPITLPEQSGGASRVRLWWRQQPAANLLLRAVNRQAPEAGLALRSDADGYVDLPAMAAGRWLLSAVYIEAAPVWSSEDWRSYWTSLTLELPQSPASDSSL